MSFQASIHPSCSSPSHEHHNEPHKVSGQIKRTKQSFSYLQVSLAAYLSSHSPHAVFFSLNQVLEFDDQPSFYASEPMRWSSVLVNLVLNLLDRLLSFSIFNTEVLQKHSWHCQFLVDQKSWFLTRNRICSVFGIGWNFCLYRYPRLLLPRTGLTS